MGHFLGGEAHGEPAPLASALSKAEGLGSEQEGAGEQGEVPATHTSVKKRGSSLPRVAPRTPGHPPPASHHGWDGALQAQCGDHHSPGTPGEAPCSCWKGEEHSPGQLLGLPPAFIEKGEAMMRI